MRIGVPPSSVNCFDGGVFFCRPLAPPGIGAMRVPRPAAGMITMTFMAGCKYTSAAQGVQMHWRCGRSSFIIKAPTSNRFSGVTLMDFATRALHWLWGNTQPIFQLLAAASVTIGALAYWRNSRLERARWLSSLYSKFYEALDLKMIRETLDCSAPNAAGVQKLVEDEDARFTDYLNFFEFMAYLRACGQLSTRDVGALFDYYLRVLTRHEDVRKYVMDDRNGYGYLKKLLPRFSA